MTVLHIHLLKLDCEFKRGRTVAENEPQSGHPKDVTVPISKLMKCMKPCMAMNNRIVTIQHIAISVGISFGLV